MYIVPIIVSPKQFPSHLSFSIIIKENIFTGTRNAGQIFWFVTFDSVISSPKQTILDLAPFFYRP
jgi:hypothetical protein